MAHVPARLGAGHRGHRPRFNASGQSGGHRTKQCEAFIGLFRHRPCRLHPYRNFGSRPRRSRFARLLHCDLRTDYGRRIRRRFNRPGQGRGRCPVRFRRIEPARANSVPLHDGVYALFGRDSAPGRVLWQILSLHRSSEEHAG